MSEVVERQTSYTEWFNSPFYHKLYFEKDEEQAKSLIHKLIQHLQPAHGSRLIDIGCGQGHHSRILASLGFDVTGIDLSPANIEVARQSESEKLHFFFHDIRLPFWINYFDIAFILFSAFGYFKSRREHDDAIRTVAGGVKPGGILLIDYLNVHYAEEHMLYNETRQAGKTSYDIHRWHDDTQFYNKITVTDPSLKESATFTEKTAKFSLGDFTDMLSYQGMQVQEVFGDYQLGPYNIKKSPRLIVVARKKNNEATDKEKRLYSDGRTTDPLT